MELGKNIEAKNEGGKLTLVIDMTKRLGRSKSGKTTIVATTNGNVSVAGPKGDVVIGINAYVKD